MAMKRREALTESAAVHLHAHGDELVPALRVDADVARDDRVLQVVALLRVVVLVPEEHLKHKYASSA